MDKIKISTAQFEHKNADKAYNLSIIEKLSEKASAEGSNIIAFHECSVTGYTFARHLSKEQMLELAEPIPGVESILKLIEIAQKYNIIILKKTPIDHNKTILFNYIGNTYSFVLTFNIYEHVSGESFTINWIFISILI